MNKAKGFNTLLGISFMIFSIGILSGLLIHQDYFLSRIRVLDFQISNQNLDERKFNAFIESLKSGDINQIIDEYNGYKDFQGISIKLTDLSGKINPLYIPENMFLESNLKNWLIVTPTIFFNERIKYLEGQLDHFFIQDYFKNELRRHLTLEGLPNPFVIDSKILKAILSSNLLESSKIDELVTKFEEKTINKNNNKKFDFNSFDAIFNQFHKLFSSEPVLNIYSADEDILNDLFSYKGFNVNNSKLLVYDIKKARSSKSLEFLNFQSYSKEGVNQSILNFLANRPTIIQAEIRNLNRSYIANLFLKYSDTTLMNIQIVSFRKVLNDA